MKYLVFDVESIGLHGQAFAVGGVIADTVSFEIKGDFLFSCPPDNVRGMGLDRDWVRRNVPDLHPQLDTAEDVRRAFCATWLPSKLRGARLAADCPWPVEARFLAECIDQGDLTQDEGPYPLVDINSLLVYKLDNPVLYSHRLPNELPAHNPLNDARQSARFLLELFREDN
jgi:hypothetical protein